MGPYCEFCDRRCFVPIPAGAPEHPHKHITIIATCPQGQELDKQVLGFCWNDVKENGRCHDEPSDSKAERSRSMDGEGPSVQRDRVDELDVPCPHCGALPHNPCVTPGGREVGYVHEMRAALSKPRSKIRGR